MASSTAQLKKCKGGGVTGAIVPPKKKIDNFPLMSYVAKNCTFEDDGQVSALETEEYLKAANDRRFEDLLNQAAHAAKEQMKGTASSEDEDSRKKALELIHSLEWARNQEDNWKVAEPAAKQKPDYGGFLHPLKRGEKEEYFSGMMKIKQPKERKRSRSRSDEVIVLNDGKLVSKTTNAQLPIQLNLPSPRRNIRVPSVGLPFTPGPPPSNTNNAWMQRSGSALFSNTESSTLTAYGVGCDEEEAMALAIAESIRTAKEEQQRYINLRDLYNFESNTPHSDMYAALPFERPPPDPIGASWDTDEDMKKNPQSQPSQFKSGPFKVVTAENKKQEVKVNGSSSQKGTNYYFPGKEAGSGNSLNLPKNEQRPKYSTDNRDMISKSSTKMEATNGIQADVSKCSREALPVSKIATDYSELKPIEDQLNNTHCEKNSEKHHRRTVADTTFSPAPAPSSPCSSGKKFKVNTLPAYVSYTSGTSYVSPDKTDSRKIKPAETQSNDYRIESVSSEHVDMQNQYETPYDHLKVSLDRMKVNNSNNYEEMEPSKSNRYGTSLPAPAVNQIENLQNQDGAQTSTGSKPSRMPISMPALFSAKKSLPEQAISHVAKPATSLSISSQRDQTTSANEKVVIHNDSAVKGASDLYTPEEKQKCNDVQSSVEPPQQNMEQDVDKAGSHLSDGVRNLCIPVNPLLPSGIADQMQQNLQLQQLKQHLQQQQQLLMPPPLPMFNQLPPSGSSGVPEIPPDMASTVAGAQYYQMLIMQQMLGSMPSMPIDGNLSCFGPSLTHCSKLDDQKNQVQLEVNNNIYQSPPGLQNNLPSGMPVLNTLPLGFPGLQNSSQGGPHTLENPVPANLSELQNAFAAGLPGLQNTLPAGFLGFPNISPGNLPGLLSASPASHPGLPNAFSGIPGGIPGLPAGFPNSVPSNLPGQQSYLPASLQNAAPIGFPGMLNCNSFGGMVPSLPQPGQVPLISGKGRGRLNRAAP